MPSVSLRRCHRKKVKVANFSEIAVRYEKNSVVQKSASDRLFDLVEITGCDDVLEIGCGTGHLTKQIVEKTKGRVVGVDASDGMIKEAKRNYSYLGLNFDVCSADRLQYADSFDVIFCNSTFQ